MWKDENDPKGRDQSSEVFEIWEGCFWKIGAGSSTASCYLSALKAESREFLDEHTFSRELSFPGDPPSL